VTAVLRWLLRATILAAVLAAALLAGFVTFTALGVGSGAAPRAPVAGCARPRARVFVADASPGGRRGRSESIGRREGGGAGDPHAPILGDQLPLAPARFDGPIARYRRYAALQVRRLGPEVAALAAAVRADDRSAARAAWRVAFARYLRLGAVYGAFGALDTDVDGLPGHLRAGAKDARFIGLHRIELGLWASARATSLVPVVRRLRHDVRRLARAVVRAPITPLDYATRAHEILEDAQRDFLTGAHVPWSHEGVLATDSALAATQVVISTLSPLLEGQQSQVTTQAGLDRLRTTLRSLREAHRGRLPTLRALTAREHERLVGSMDWALERLQTIPGSLETRDPAPIPKLRGR
jgi:high-affinity iron transporter